jgi:hypothetical protein
VIPRSSPSYVVARFRRPTHLLQCPHWTSLRSPEVASAGLGCRHRLRRRLQTSFRRMGYCIFWRFGFRQSSFRRVARVPQRTAPYAWTRPLISCHALFPLSFRSQVRHQTQKHPSKFLPTTSGIQRSASWRSDPYPPDLSRWNSYGALTTDFYSCTFSSRLPDPHRLAVPIRPVVVRAASRPPRHLPVQAALSSYRSAATARRRSTFTSAWS